MGAKSLHTEVVVVGAGPVGLMVAAELRRYGVDVLVLEREVAPTEQSRASTLHARTMEIFEARGLLGELGTPPNEALGHFGGIPLDLTLPSRFSGQWKVPQSRTEALLGEWAVGLGAKVRRGWCVEDIGQFADGVEVGVRSPSGIRSVRAEFVVACDGETSTVRRCAGMRSSGSDGTRELLRADVADLDIRNRRFERLDGGFAVAARGAAGLTRVMVHRYGSVAGARDGEPTFAEFARTWTDVTGEHIGDGKAVWVNAFRDTNRQVDSYRHGRVLFAGDAAHQQMPSGGQALNLGLQDAVNLGWKLAQRLQGGSDEVLDTYHSERHPVGARVLANIRVQTELLLGGPQLDAVRECLRELIELEPVRRYLAAMVSGLDVRYPVTPGRHPSLGTRFPDAMPAAESLCARWALLVFDSSRWEGLRRATAPWAEWVTVNSAETSLLEPGLGGAVLLRPDGHIAWAGSSDQELTETLRRWLGSGTN
ncbi:FAD-dependent oxidoreductase [Nocardia sp. NPDC055053]